jgi:altronate dehydratase large subunit
VSGVLRGYRRSDGRLGARNHILVLPSVVCADQTATLIGAETGAISVVHQHGCGQVGDDVAHTERAFLGFATNPNVGAAVVVSLGCETIQGKRLAGLIEERGQRLEFVGIQQLGGTFKTVDHGREAVARLRARLVVDPEVEAGLGDLVLGIAADGPNPLAHELAELALAQGASVVVAIPDDARSDWSSAPGLEYGQPAATGLSLVEHAGDGAEQHLALAGAGAQVIVSLRGPGRAPQGFATGPVLAVAGDPAIYLALEDDFDLDASATNAELIWERVLATFNGEQTASERRGARDFVLHRIARTM